MKAAVLHIPLLNEPRYVSYIKFKYWQNIIENDAYDWEADMKEEVKQHKINVMIGKFYQKLNQRNHTINKSKLAK